jgi:hypothetical protein
MQTAAMKAFLVPLLVLLLPCTGMTDVLFSDDFNDGNADGWFELNMIEYEVVDSMYYFHGGYEENHGISFNGDNAGFMSVPDYSAMCSVILETGYFIGMLTRFSEIAEYNLMLVLCPPTSELRLYSWHWTGLVLMDDAYFPVEYGQQYWLRFEAEGIHYRGKAWSGEPGDEPGTWMVSADDAGVTGAGSIALFCVGVSSDEKANLSGLFDDVVVSDPIPSVLQSGTWGCLKAIVIR